MIPIPRIFEGQPVFIVGGGPSLRGFDWERLRDKNVIAINRAYEVVPQAAVLWWSDARFWRHHRDGITGHRAPYKATCTTGYFPEDEVPSWVFQYGMTGVSGFDTDPTHLRHGNNSAYAAQHLAAHLGAKLEILLGVDMRHGPKGESHFHEGHGFQHLEETLTNYMAPYFKSLQEPLAERGVAVLNASVDSALTVWPRCTIDAGLEAYDRAMLSK